MSTVQHSPASLFVVFGLQLLSWIVDLLHWLARLLGFNLKPRLRFVYRRHQEHLMANVLSYHRIAAEIARETYGNADMVDRFRLTRSFQEFSGGYSDRIESKRMRRMLHQEPAKFKEAIIRELVDIGDMLPVQVALVYPHLHR